jgi:hypothetical protein
MYAIRFFFTAFESTRAGYKMNTHNNIRKINPIREYLKLIPKRYQIILDRRVYDEATTIERQKRYDNGSTLVDVRVHAETTTREDQKIYDKGIILVGILDSKNV